jgi:hypothetical protein
MSADRPSGPEFKRTTAAHFSPLADRQTPPHQIPPCAACGAPSLGAHILNDVPGSQNTFDVVFQCAQCGTQPFEIMSSALFPHYAVMGPGSYTRVRRLTRDEAMKRVTQ